MSVVIPAADAVDDRHALRLASIGGQDLAAGDAAGIGETLKLHPGDDVGRLAVGILGKLGRVPHLKAGGDDDGSHVQFQHLVLLVKVDRAGLAHHLADPAGVRDLAVGAVVLAEADAGVGVNHRHAGHRLQRWHPDSRGWPQRLLLVDRLFFQHDLDSTGGTHDGASPAADALARLFQERRAYPPLDTGLGKVQHIGLDQFVARTHAQAAEDTFLVRIVCWERWLHDAVFPRQVLDDRHVGAARKEQSQDDLAGLHDRRGVGFDL